MNDDAFMNDPQLSFGLVHGSSSGPSSGSLSGPALQELINALAIDENNASAQVSSSTTATGIPKRQCDRSDLSHTFIHSDGGISGFSGPNEWKSNVNTDEIFFATNALANSSAAKNSPVAYQHNAAADPEYSFSSGNSLKIHNANETPSISTYQHSVNSSRDTAAAQNYRKDVPILPVNGTGAQHQR